jgi:hypothetical protein
MKKSMTLLAGLLGLALAVPAATTPALAHDKDKDKWPSWQHDKSWDDDDWRKEFWDFRKDRKQDNWSYREERRDDWRDWKDGRYDSRGELYWDRKKDRWSWRQERHDDRWDFWQDLSQDKDSTRK